MKDKNRTLRVGIIGAGPSGLTLALALSRRENIHITVFEKSPDHRETPPYNPLRSYTIDITGHGARAVNYLNAAERFDKDLIKFKGIRIPIIKPMIEETYHGEGWTGSRGDIARALLEEILKQNASRNNTVILFNTEAKLIDAVNGTISYNNFNNKESFDLIVGCDGAGSGVRTLLKDSNPIFQIENLDNENYAMMLPFDRNTEDLDPRYLYIFGLPPYLAVAGAVNGKSGPSDPIWFCQIGFSGSRKFSSPEEAESFLKKHYFGIKKHSLLRYASSKAVEEFSKQENISTGRAKRCSSFHYGKTVLLGDAASPFPPVGQGVNAAMEMAVVFDQCLEEALASHPFRLEKAVSAAAEKFTKKWKPEADAISRISFHGLDLRRFRPAWFGKIKTAGLVILHKLFGRDPMTNAKREDMTYSQALAYRKKVDLILWAVFACSVLAGAYGFLHWSC